MPLSYPKPRFFKTLALKYNVNMETLETILGYIDRLGYIGVMALMFIESSFIPFPSEVVIPPAGYLASQGKMELDLVIISGTLGSLLGAIFNYIIAAKLGRPFFERYGKKFLVNKKTLNKAERFFLKHGGISTFLGRLLPGIRQYISLPAGFLKMPFLSFCLFTTLGAGIWVTILAIMGYYFGQNQELLQRHLKEVSIGLIVVVFIVALLYFKFWGKKFAEKDT
jgi:membrane protein DedA with SNARE-associated domain